MTTSTVVLYVPSVEPSTVGCFTSAKIWLLRCRYWFDQPTLQVPGTDTKLQTVTGTVPDDMEPEERCVCTAVRYAGTAPRSQTTAYPPLPKDATEVEVTLPGLDPVTVPITR